MVDKEKFTRKAEHLKVDPPVVLQLEKPTMTQNWFVVSFISPMDRVKQRFIYESGQFLYHDVNKQIMDTTMNVVRNVNVDLEKILEKKIETYQSSSDPVYKAAADILETARKELTLDEDQQVAKVLRTYRLDQEELLDRFETYKSQNYQELETDFSQKFGDEPSVFGFKVRGSYEEQKEAEARATYVRDNVESYVNTMIGPVGYWVPFDPNADTIKRQEYSIPQLNDLMAKKIKNEKQKDEFFEKRKQQMIEDSKKPAGDLIKEKLRKKLKEMEELRKPKPK